MLVFRGGTRRFRLVAVRANGGQPAFGCYVTDVAAPDAPAQSDGLTMLTLAGDRIAGVTRFLDNSLPPRFGLPATLP